MSSTTSPFSPKHEVSRSSSISELPLSPQQVNLGRKNSRKESNNSIIYENEEAEKEDKVNIEYLKNVIISFFEDNEHRVLIYLIFRNSYLL